MGIGSGVGTCMIIFDKNKREKIETTIIKCELA